jgi:hypothetical protein
LCNTRLLSFNQAGSLVSAELNDVNKINASNGVGQFVYATHDQAQLAEFAEL